LVACSVIVFGLGFSSLLAPSAAAASAPAANGHYCVTVIEKIHPPAPDSRIVSHKCANSPNSPALATPDARTVLVRFYRDADYSPSYEYIDTIKGRNGPCDASGYGLPDLTRANNDIVKGISSYIYYNSCDAQEYWNGLYYGRFGGYPHNNYGVNPYVGDTWNDHVYSMRLWNG
jgi:hypothetical protein